MYWRVREWLKQGGKLSKHPAWMQLATVKFRTVESKGVIEIMSKTIMHSKNIPSPGVADALALTFYNPTTALAISEEEKFFMRKMREQKRRKGGGYGLRMVNR